MQRNNINETKLLSTYLFTKIAKPLFSFCFFKVYFSAFGMSPFFAFGTDLPKFIIFSCFITNDAISIIITAEAIQIYLSLKGLIVRCVALHCL